MAFSESDIEKIKSAVPPEFRPRPDQAEWLSSSFLTVGAIAPTPLKGSENNLDPLASDKAREWESLMFATGTPDGASASFVLTGAQAAIQSAAQEKTKQEERDADDRRVFDQIKAALDQRLAAIDTELAGLATRLAEIHQRQAVLGVELEELDELAAASADPTNPRYKALAAKYGLSLDDKDFDAKLKALKKVRGDEHTALTTEANDNIKRAGQLNTERVEVTGARAEIENANSDEAWQHAKERGQTILGKQQLGEAGYQSSSRDAKIAVAEIVSQTDKTGTSKDNNSYMQAALVDTDKFLSKSDEVDWSDDTQKPASAATLPKP